MTDGGSSLASVSFAHLSGPAGFDSSAKSNICKESKTFATALAVLSPILEGYPPDAGVKIETFKSSFSWKRVFRPKSSSESSNAKRRDAELKLLLQSLASPLACVPKQVALPRPTTPDLTAGQKITRDVIKRFIGATGGYGIHSSQQNQCIAGSTTMWVSELALGEKLAHSSELPAPEATSQGSFAFWQSPPGSWYIEVEVGGMKSVTACDGNVAWRNEWGSYHTARGPLRPSRRALEGLDPPTIADVFTPGEYSGDEVVDGDSCTKVKVSANPLALMAMSSGPSGVGGEQPLQNTCDVLLFEVEGFFSKSSGLLVGLRDYQVTKLKTADGEVMFWKRTMVTKMEDFRRVDSGMILPHQGKAILMLSKECEDEPSASVKASVREIWTIENVVHNRVPDLPSSFSPPSSLPPMQNDDTSVTHLMAR